MTIKILHENNYDSLEKGKNFTTYRHIRSNIIFKVLSNRVFYLKIYDYLEPEIYLYELFYFNREKNKFIKLFEDGLNERPLNQEKFLINIAKLAIQILDGEEYNDK